MKINSLLNIWLNILFTYFLQQQGINNRINYKEMHQQFFKVLINQDASIADRYFAVFQLKNIGTHDAIKALIDAYPACGSSVLLKHQLLYALGQLPQNTYNMTKKFLIQKVEDEAQNALSRHEAAEALANYFDKDLLGLYQKYLHSQCKQLKYTCQIAIEKVKHNEIKNKYGLDYHGTREPAAPYSDQQVLELKTKHKLEGEHPYLQLLLFDKISLFQKYRLMYFMRNKKSKYCIQVLCSLLTKKYFKTQCSLLKHQICFIIGQIGCQGYEHMIQQCIENQEEEQIVRHEALAAVASQSKDQQYLDKFVKGNYGQLIKQSAEVAIHSIKYWNQ